MRNRIKTATPAVQTFVQDKADEVEIPQETAQPTEPQEPEPQDDENDESWLDDLTPYEISQPQAQVQTQTQTQTPPPQPEPEQGTPEQQKRLADLYKDFEHIDEDVAAEFDSKMIAPIRAELNELRAYRKQEQERQQKALVANANNKIFAKHQKAEKILQSQQFKDFVNADSDPYAADTGFDRLMHAYYAGDGEYVVRKIDAFVAGRGKPKPPVGAEPHQGSGGSSIGNVPVKPMTETEYLARRQAIRSAPRGTYPPNALKQLAEQYQLSRG